ncbi:MAG: DinB family protein [Ilumatobacteraceae bacterium]
MEACAVCGFVWDDVPAEEVVPRSTAAALAIAAQLDAAGAVTTQRPAPDRWSMLEYGGHVRDVILNLRERIILGAVEDNPVPKPMYGTARVDLGLYAADAPDVVADELAIAADLFARTFAALTPEQLARPIFYGWPEAATRTLLWVAAQTVHEAEHHLGDVVDDRRLLTS